jgi:hypothetical protein
MLKTWMRWGTCAVAVGLSLVPVTGRAGESEKPEAAPEARHTLVLAQPLSALMGQVVVGVEHAAGSHVTLAGDVMGSVLRYGSEYDEPKGANFSTRSWAAGVAPGVHFYFTGHAPEGFWVGPHLELSMQRQSSRSKYIMVPGQEELLTLEGSSRTVNYGGSVRVGYTAILSPGLTVQVGASLVAQSSRTTPFSSRILEEPETPIWGLGFSSSETLGWSVAPRMTVGLGWAF